MAQITKTDTTPAKQPLQGPSPTADAKADEKAAVVPQAGGAAPAANKATLSGKPGQSALSLPGTTTTVTKKTTTTTTTTTVTEETTTTTSGEATKTEGAKTSTTGGDAPPREIGDNTPLLQGEKVPGYQETFGNQSYVKDGSNKDLLGLAQKVVDKNPALKDSPLAQHIKGGQLGPEDVKALQGELQSKGFDVGKTGVDGKYGPNTHAALQQLVGGEKPATPAAPSQQQDPQQPATPSDNAALEKLKGMSMDDLRKLGPKEFLDALRPAAEEAEKKYGVPAAVTLAQAAYESGYGKHTPGKDSFNFFGVKGKGPAGTTAAASDEKNHTERHVSNFAKYHNAYEAVMEHGKLFHNGYYGKALDVAAKGGSNQQFLKAIEGVYHQDGGSYTRATMSIINKYHLDQK
jgi:flagellum-specific peptidoglycan hydrolase FlgJ